MTCGRVGLWDTGEELVVDGSKVTDLCRLPRSRCDAFLAVGGLPAGEKVPGSLLSSVISAGSGRGGLSTGTTTTVVETGTANSRGIGQLELCFPSPVRSDACIDLGFQFHFARKKKRSMTPRKPATKLFRV